MSELDLDLEIFLGMPLSELPEAQHRHATLRRIEHPLWCARCGADAQVHRLAEMPPPLATAYWLDLCPDCDAELVFTTPAAPYTG